MGRKACRPLVVRANQCRRRRTLVYMFFCCAVALWQRRSPCFTRLCAAPVASPPRANRPALDRTRRSAAASSPIVLQTRATLDLVTAQSEAGFKFKELGEKLLNTYFKATALDGNVRVAVDGFQELKSVEIDKSVVGVAGNNNETLANAVLSALQEAHDSSYERTREDVWNLYKQNVALMQAPLGQIGVGNTAADLWVNVENTEETIGMAGELFEKFDADGDGWWSHKEASQVQLATEGTEMPEDAFHALLIAAAPNGGRDLSEEDLEKGLSKEQVIELYTDADRQRSLGFVLDIHKDHATVFAAVHTDPAEAAVLSEVD